MLLRKGLISAGGLGQNNYNIQLYGSWRQYKAPLFWTYNQAAGLAYRQFNSSNTDSMVLKDRGNNI